MKLHPYHHAKKTPDKTAYIMASSGEIVTYRQLEERSNQGAHLFREFGLKRGDNIALLMENSPRLPEICFAAARSGLLYTPISTKLSPSEITYIVEDCGAKVLIASSTLGKLARDAFSEARDCRHLFFVGDPVDGVSSWEDVTESLPRTPIADQSAGADMLYSSGTTGRPKGVKLTLRALEFDDHPRIVGLQRDHYGMSSDTVYLNPAPLYHSAPLRFSLGVMRLGGTVVIMDRFDAETALKHIEGFKITHSQWVPSMFVRLLNLPEEVRARYDVSSLRQAIHASAPCPIEIKEKMMKWWGPILYEYYAGSEGSGFIACSPQEWRENKGAVGRPLVGDIKILDENGDVLPAGPTNVGDIYFADAPLFEYHNDPEKTAESRSKQGWTTLGDIGFLNDRGYLFLTDRKSNMIISGGVNIYPQEVENLLLSHPLVADAAVIGVPNESFGEEVKAVIQPNDWANATDALGQELIAFCRGRISHIKCPKSVDFMQELPRHPNGKLYKRLIRDTYWAGRDNNLV